MSSPVTLANLTIASAAALLASCAPSRQVPGTPLVMPEHLAHSIAALGFPGAHRAFQVGSGSVVSSGETALEWRLVGTDSARTSPVYFERDGVPVAHWWMVSGADSVHFEAAAVPNRRLGDSSLVLSVRATAIRRAAASGELRLEARVRGRPEGPYFVPWDAADTDRFEERWDGHGVIRNGLLVAAFDPALEIRGGAPSTTVPAHVEGWGSGRLVAALHATMAPGAPRHWDFILPAYPVPPRLGLQLARQTRHEDVVARARTAWRGWLAKASPLELPDARVMAAYRAALVTLILCHERNGEAWIPIGNPFQYRDVWLRDGARVVRALAVSGLTDLARADALTIQRFQLPTGVLISQPGQIDGTGQALWAFDQAASLPPSARWARRFLPTADRALEWIERQRRITREFEIPWPGMLPFVYPRDNELVRAQLIGNDAWAIAGCRATASLARRAGNERLADEAFEAFRGYRASLDSALARSPYPDLPPSWQGIGRDWGNLVLGYPTLALPAGQPRLAALAARKWARGPGPVSWGPPDSLHAYMGTDLAQWALLAGRGREAIVYLGRLLDRSTSTLGQAELFEDRDGGFGANLPPHATAAATLVDLIRNMIVLDVRDTLELGLGAPLSWWRGTHLERAPTRFGTIQVSLLRPDPRTLRAQWTPVLMPTRIRIPYEVRGVGLGSMGARLVSGGWVECPPGTREAVIRVAPADPEGRGR